MARTTWSYEALRIAVLHVLREEGPHTTRQLCERIGVKPNGNIGTVLRNLDSSGHITSTGWPRLYDITDQD